MPMPYTKHASSEHAFRVCDCMYGARARMDEAPASSCRLEHTFAAQLRVRL